MKNLFPGYFKEDEADIKEIWGKSLFVFDANILLNLYRYSDATKNEFLRIMERVKGSAWLPHRAAEEYLTNRLTVIDQQEKSYDDAIKAIESLKGDLKNSRQHPFVSESTIGEANKAFELLTDELIKNKEVHAKRIFDDEIKSAILKIFDGKVGSGYDKENLDRIVKEGEDRYKQKTPPGFRDAGKASDGDTLSDICRKYGDLLVWYQVIDKSIECGKGVILVTDDKKEDWWERFKGKTIGPRPELVKEFKDRTNNTFHMYQSDRFLNFAVANLGENVSEEIVKEVREVRLREHTNNEIVKVDLNHYINATNIQQKKMESRLLSYEQEKLMLQERMRELNEIANALAAKFNFFPDDMDSESDKKMLSDEYSVISSELNKVRRQHERLLLEQKMTEKRMKVVKDEIDNFMRLAKGDNYVDE